jgi:hypothetical protein
MCSWIELLLKLWPENQQPQEYFDLTLRDVIIPQFIPVFYDNSELDS